MSVTHSFVLRQRSRGLGSPDAFFLGRVSKPPLNSMSGFWNKCGIVTTLRTPLPETLPLPPPLPHTVRAALSPPPIRDGFSAWDSVGWFLINFLLFLLRHHLIVSEDTQLQSCVTGRHVCLLPLLLLFVFLVLLWIKQANQSFFPLNDDFLSEYSSVTEHLANLEMFY